MNKVKNILINFKGVKALVMIYLHVIGEDGYTQVPAHQISSQTGYSLKAVRGAIRELRNEVINGKRAIEVIPIDKNGKKMSNGYHVLPDGEI